MTQFNQVLTFAEQQQVFTSRDMAEELSITPAKASTFCAELHDIGLVKKDGAVRNPENTGRNLILWRWR